MEYPKLVMQSLQVPQAEDQLSPRDQSPRQHPMLERTRRLSTETPLFVSHENVKPTIQEKELSPRSQEINHPYALNKREQKKAVVIQVLSHSSGRRPSQGEERK